MGSYFVTHKFGIYACHALLSCNHHPTDPLMTRLVRTINALIILILVGVIFSAYYQQFFKHERPCPLCILQRLGMIGVSTGLMLNLRFGVKIAHYGLALLSAFIGGAIAARQICLHICPGFPIFGIPVFGLELYTWSFIVFCCAVLSIILLLFLYAPSQKSRLPLNAFEALAFMALIVITILNLISTYMECGFGPCIDLPWSQSVGK